jgi:hypothetical protein
VGASRKSARETISNDAEVLQENTGKHETLFLTALLLLITHLVGSTCIFFAGCLLIRSAKRFLLALRLVRLNDLEFQAQFLVSQTVFWNARRECCMAKRARSEKFFVHV